jgi:hypothetical protein
MSEAEMLLRDLPAACRAARQHDGSPGDRGAALV